MNASLNRLADDFECVVKCRVGSAKNSTNFFTQFNLGITSLVNVIQIDETSNRCFRLVS